MSTEKPNAPEDAAAAASTAELRRELEGLPDAAPLPAGERTTSPAEPEGNKGEEVKRFPWRSVRIAAVALLPTLAVALAWVVLTVLTGDGSTHRPGPASGALPAKAPKADRGGSDRTRWVAPPGTSARPRRRHSAVKAQRARRRSHSRQESSHSVPAEPEAPSPPPAYTAPPEPAPEPAPPPAEPKEEPRIRDGATESEEFGL